MKVAVSTTEQNLRVKEAELPTIDQTGAIVKILGCGLCGSDLVKIKDKNSSENIVHGHEIVGEIVELKINNKSIPFKKGDIIVAGHHVPCYKCHYCNNKNYSMCSKFKQTNFIPGGFSEYIFLSEDHLEHTAIKVPDNLSEIEASFCEPAACCVRAIKRSDIKQNDKVLIIGLGSIGILMGQIARHYGAYAVGCDLIDKRIKAAKSLGFDDSIKFETQEITSDYIIDKCNNIGADQIFLTSGSKSSLDLAVKSIRSGGKIIIFSSISSPNAYIHNNEIYYRELSLIGCYSASPEDLKDSIYMLEKGIIKTDNLTTVYDFKDINLAVEDTIKNKIIKAYIKISQINNDISKEQYK